MDLCSSVSDTKTPEGSVKCGTWGCRSKSDLRLLPQETSEGVESVLEDTSWQVIAVVSN